MLTNKATFFNKTHNVLLTLFVMFTLTFVLLYHSFIFGDKAYIFLVPNSDYLINYLAYHNYILTHYSNNIITNFIYGFGIGSNPFTVKALILDPFNILFLFPIKFANFIILAFYTKLLTINFIIYTALGLRSNKIINNLIIAYMFTFCGMFIYWSTQDSNFTAMLFSLLLWLGYELFRIRKRVFVFVACGLPLFIFASLYWVIMFNVFFILFIVLDKIWDNQDFHSKLKYFMQLGLGYLIIMFISAWSTMPEYYVLVHNARVGGTPILELLKMLAHINIYCQFILRGFGNFIILPERICASLFSGPLWFSSIFILVSFCAYILSNRTKKLNLNILTAIILFIFLPITSLFFNGFSQATMRWSWYIIIPLTICTLRFWQVPNIQKFRLSLVILLSIFLIVACYAYCFGDVRFNNYNLLITYVEIILIFVFLFFASYLRKYTFMVLALIGIVDTLFNSYMFIKNTRPINREYQIKHQYYYDSSINIVKKIKSNGDKEFYRIDKTYSSLNLCEFCGLNENLIQGYNGVKQYISTPNPYYFKFNVDMATKAYYNFIFGFDGRYDILRMLGVKYILSKNESAIDGYVNKEPQRVSNGIYVYKATNYKGIGYIFHNYITYDDFMQLSVEDKDRAFTRCTILTSATAADVAVSKMARKINYSECLKNNSVLNENQDSFYLKKMNGHTIIGFADLKSDGILYLAIPYDKGFSAKVDDKKTNILNVSDGFLGLKIGSGKHKIELTYFPPLLTEGISVTCLGILILVFYLLRKKSK